jgi:hypothetical protein
MKKKKKANKNRTNSDAVIINAKDRTSLSLEDIDKAVKDVKRTKAENATIVVGPRTEVADDVREFANQRGVEIATMASDNEPSTPEAK